MTAQSPSVQLCYTVVITLRHTPRMNTQAGILVIMLSVVKHRFTRRTCVKRPAAVGACSDTAVEEVQGNSSALCNSPILCGAFTCAQSDSDTHSAVKEMACYSRRECVGSLPVTCGS